VNWSINLFLSHNEAGGFLEAATSHTRGRASAQRNLGVSTPSDLPIKKLPP